LVRFLVCRGELRARGEHGAAQPSAAREPGRGCVIRIRLLVVPAREAVRDQGAAPGSSEVGAALGRHGQFGLRLRFRHGPLHGDRLWEGYKRRRRQAGESVGEGRLRFALRVFLILVNLKDFWSGFRVFTDVLAKQVFDSFKGKEESKRTLEFVKYHGIGNDFIMVSILRGYIFPGIFFLGFIRVLGPE
jgi:hypothetical protein